MSALAQLGWILLLVVASVVFGGVVVFLQTAKHMATVNFWVAFLRNATPKRRLDVKIALLAAELIVDPPPPEQGANLQ